ncbi:hypothetical protein B7P43_G06954 [Cryptotermes secundus]|uniref:Tc1-like transposase DDE domain-containing protein n=1 Tax=Cryptotermes secundus TaxID=105785 RepID=A0A2J7QN34_9NEOP|nr:hypothetical protein B7P43_G06954 [Cryptotermes secundus]
MFYNNLRDLVEVFLKRKEEEIRAGFQSSPRKSIRQASRQFYVPPITVHRVLHPICSLTQSCNKMEHPPHWGLDVRRSLSATFQDRWIGRRGPIRWPPRSPDLTPLNFFLWGYVKDRVFVPPVNELADLQAHIRETIATVPMGMLERTWQEIEYKVDILRSINDPHVEVY